MLRVRLINDEGFVGVLWWCNENEVKIGFYVMNLLWVVCILFIKCVFILGNGMYVWYEK